MKKVITGFVIGIMISLFYFFDTFYLFEKNIQDRLTTEERPGDLRIKIVAIDDASLNEIGRWPWSRQQLANIVETLIDGGATAVWLDFVFSETSQNIADDEKLQQLVQENANVYLSSYFNFTPRQSDSESLAYLSYQEPVFPIDKEQIGHINVLQDADRVVRKSILGVPHEDGTIVPTISVRLANLLLSENKQIFYSRTENKWFSGTEIIPTNRRNEMVFSYASNPTASSFDVISIKDVLNETVPSSSFMNTIILIGPYTVGLQDQYLTPMSQTVPMNGVEIHANIMQSLTEGKWFQVLSSFAGILLIMALCIIGYPLLQRIRSKYVIFVAGGMFILYIIVFLVAFEQFHMILPLFYPLLAILFIYIAIVVSHYVEEQVEKKRITNIFGRYVSKNIVEQLIEANDEVTLAGERKDVTLMFVDMRGFTSLSEKMEPEEVVEVLNEYLELCSQAIFAYEGTIDKFMGDGIMVIFGAPVSQADHALRAVRTAIKMQEEAAKFSQRLEKKYERPVAFGIGIHSGPAVVGNIGSLERLDYTAIGDTVNLAARLESHAKPHQILISDATYGFIKDVIHCHQLEPIQVKGKRKPVSVYDVAIDQR